MNRVDTFIANIYRSVRFRDTAGFREATLRSLGVLVPFDGALWGSGNLHDRTFHSVVTLGVHEDYPQALERTSEINPILPALLEHLNTAVSMSQVISDEELYASKIYRTCFSKFGVERILSCVDLDPRSHIYSLISLYRFDREQDFDEKERATFERAAYHMVNAAQNAFFMHIANEAGGDSEIAAAICDSHGLFYEAQSEFLDLIEQRFPDWQAQALPFEIPEPGDRALVNGLCVESEPFGDLHYLRMWEERPTDILSKRDRDIVNGVCNGMTFKEIARELHMAPSTVSNRLYRIYRKLGVTSRSSLAKLVRGELDQQMAE